MRNISSTPLIDMMSENWSQLTMTVNGWLFSMCNSWLIFGLVVFIMFIEYYLRIVVAKPELFCANKNFRSFLMTNCSKVREPYWPPIWGFQTHVQTLLPSLVRGLMPSLPYHREILRTSDGGQISLDWFTPVAVQKNKGDTTPIALFIPGIVGDSQTDYMKSVLPIAHNLGYRVVAFNRRARGGLKMLTPRFYCMCSCKDMKLVLQHIRNNNPKSKLVAIGFSMGAIHLGRYLIEEGEQAVVDATFLISLPWNVKSTCDNVSRPGTINYKLNKCLAKILCDTLAENRQVLESVPQINFEDVIHSKDLYTFDKNFTIKMCGFDSVEDYYRHCSIKGQLSKIKRPTLCLNAKDDMFSPAADQPIDEVEGSPNVALLLTKRGGHIGFMEGFLPLLPYFLENLLHQYLSSIIKLHNVRKELSQCPNT